MKEAMTRLTCRSTMLLLVVFCCCVGTRAQSSVDRSTSMSTTNSTGKAEATTPQALTADDYQSILALTQSEQWDNAFIATDQFLRKYAGDPLWKARGLYARGLLFALASHHAYKVGNRLYRGDTPPHLANGEIPQDVYRSSQDLVDAVADLEGAVNAYDALPRASRPATAAEEADLFFDLAKLLPAIQYFDARDQRNASRDNERPVDPSQPYDASWPSPTKIVYLYSRIPILNPSDTHRTVLAWLCRAMYGNRIGDKADPLEILTKTADEYPGDPLAPLLRLTAAKWLENGGDHVRALSMYRTIQERYPQSSELEAANSAAHDISAESIHMSSTGGQPVGEAARISIVSRNVKRLTLHAYFVSLDKIVHDPKYLDGDAWKKIGFGSIFGDPRSISLPGPEVATWNFTTSDKGDYTPVSDTMKTPLTKVGAYLVEAESDDGKTTGATLVVVSDLAVIRKMVQDSILAFVVDAKTGRPVAGANVLIRQLYSGAVNNQGITGLDGVFIAPHAQTQDGAFKRVEIFASTPGNYYALCYDWVDYRFGPTSQNTVKGDFYTDRPVYQPGQAVDFRDIIAEGQSGEVACTPFANQVVEVECEASESTGLDIFDQKLSTNEAGSISGSFLLPKHLAPGEYSIDAEHKVINANGEVISTDPCGFSTFRVVAPSVAAITVRVVPSKAQARFGDIVTAKIIARDLLERPVTNGKVTYEIQRTGLLPIFRFPFPYDWLYLSYRDGEDTNPYLTLPTAVSKGVDITNARGEVTIHFRVDRGATDHADDYGYSITANVTDRFGRTASGVGTLHVTNQQFYAYLNLPMSFAQEGQEIEIDLRTLDADQKPVAAAGILTIYKRIFDARSGKETSQAVHTQTVNTDVDGTATLLWKSRYSGQYWAAFTSKDEHGAEVQAAIPFWIAGSDLDARSYHVNGFAFITDKVTYEQGETAHLLIASEQPDSWVLLTQETGDQILWHDLIHVATRACTVDVPIVPSDSPNVKLAAVAMRGSRFCQWNRELLVPPTQQFLNVTVTSDKTQYKPGEIGVFQIKAADAQGHPVAANVSLTLMDARLTANQQNQDVDPRSIFYGDRRIIAVDAVSSQSGQFGSVEEPEFQMITDDRHPSDMPENGRLPNEDQGFAFFGNLDEIAYHGSGKPTTYVSEYRRSADQAGPFSLAGVDKSEFPGLIGMGPSPPFDPAEGYVHLRGAYDPAPGFDRNGVTLGPSRSVSDYGASAIWEPTVLTDPRTGSATIHVVFPVARATWKVRTLGTTQTMQVGTAETTVVTK